MGQQTSCCNGRELLRADGSALIAGVISGEACMKVIGATTGTDGITTMLYSTIAIIELGTHHADDRRS